MSLFIIQRHQATLHISEVFVIYCATTNFRVRVLFFSLSAALPVSFIESIRVVVDKQKRVHPDRESMSETVQIYMTFKVSELQKQIV